MSEPIYAPDPPSDWDDYFLFAAEEAHDATRLTHDDPDRQYHMRIDAAVRAANHLKDALTALHKDHQRLAIARNMAVAMAGAGLSLESVRDTGRVS